MRIRNADIATVNEVMYALNFQCGYDLQYKAEPHMVTNSTVSVTLRPSASDSVGARKSWNGRRGPWACWHVFRDFSREMFKLNPSAIITTTMARYTVENFEDEYPETDYNSWNDLYWSDLCDCGGEHGE